MTSPPRPRSAPTGTVKEVKQPQDFHTRLANARRPERVVTICLNGDLAARIDNADAELTRLQDDGDRLSGKPQARTLAREIQDLREQMQASEQPFRIRAMPKRRWVEFIVEHPPRADDDADAAIGFNRDTFFDDLVRESIIDPVLTDDDWAALDEALTSATFDKLANAAWSINRGDVDIPFSARAFTTLQYSGETSKPLPAGE